MAGKQDRAMNGAAQDIDRNKAETELGHQDLELGLNGLLQARRISAANACNQQLVARDWMYASLLDSSFMKGFLQLC